MLMMMVSAILDKQLHYISAFESQPHKSLFISAYTVEVSVATIYREELEWQAHTGIEVTRFSLNNQWRTEAKIILTSVRNNFNTSKQTCQKCSDPTLDLLNIMFYKISYAWGTPSGQTGKTHVFQTSYPLSTHVMSLSFPSTFDLRLIVRVTLNLSIISVSFT